MFSAHSFYQHRTVLHLLYAEVFFLSEDFENAIQKTHGKYYSRLVED